MNMEAINIMKQRLMVNSRRRHLRLWNELICGPSREGTRKAKAHYRALTVPHYFEIWCLFVEKRDDGSNMRAWVGRERFDQVHNIRSVVEHRNKNTLTSHFQHWRVHAHCQIEVTRRYVAKISGMCKLVMSAWKAQSSLQRQMRTLVVNEWRDFSLRLMLIPFRAWFVWVNERVERHRTQKTLLSAYHRRKKRMTCFNMFKVWRHQALFGKTDGMHTRAELLQVIEQQKKFITAMDSNLGNAREGLALAEETVESEVGRYKELAADVADKDETVNKQQFALHNAEQEIVRLQVRGCLQAFTSSKHVLLEYYTLWRVAFTPRD